MNYKVKKVKTELSLGITIEYEDGLVKGMSLFDKGVNYVWEI